MPQKQIITGQKISSVKYARAIELRREMTMAEKKLWCQLRAGRLAGFHFRRQQIIEPYIVDFYCHQAELVVEVDGEIHLEQQEQDHRRDQDLNLIGLRVLHFSNTEVNQDLQAVLEIILRTCQYSINQSSDPQGK